MRVCGLGKVFWYGIFQIYFIQFLWARPKRPHMYGLFLLLLFLNQNMGFLLGLSPKGYTCNDIFIILVFFFGGLFS
jgi:hypothetical protein